MSTITRYKGKRLFALVIAIPLISSCSGTSEVRFNEPDSFAKFPEAAIKYKLQRSSSSEPLILAVKRLIAKGNGGEFIFPAAITYSDTGDVYVSDNIGHTIHRLPVGSSEIQTILANDGHVLRFPNSIHYWADKVVISDNEGIKILSPKGEFERLIRPYLGIFDFVITEDQTFLINTLVRNPESQDPLIVELDNHGRRLKAFGTRLGVPSHNGLEDQAFLALSEGLLFVAFKYRPLVEVYNIDSGKLLTSFEVNHPVFRLLSDELRASRVTEAKTPGRVYLPRYIAGIRSNGKRIFLCLNLPQPEIWEVDTKGKVLAQFKVSDLTPAVDIFGFDVRINDNNVVFSIGVIDTSFAASVSEVSLS
jgi:hypothetical protein